MPVGLSSIASEVRSFIVDNFLFGRDDGLADDQSFLQSGIIDSTGILELVFFLETTYRVEIGDEDLIPENLDSINNILSFITAKMGL